MTSQERNIKYLEVDFKDYVKGDDFGIDFYSSNMGK